jgi:hypothetical protein
MRGEVFYLEIVTWSTEGRVNALREVAFKALKELTRLEKVGGGLSSVGRTERYHEVTPREADKEAISSMRR